MTFHRGPRILFQASARRGLGHLRRGLNIAVELRRISPFAEILFDTRGTPPKGISESGVRFLPDTALDFDRVVRSFAPDVVVFDTLPPQGWDLHGRNGPRTAYIMRQCRRDVHDRIARSGFLKLVDTIIVPHAEAEFGQPLPPGIRSKAQFVGPIVRSACPVARHRLQKQFQLGGEELLLVSTPGGGGFQEQADQFFEVVFGVHDVLRQSGASLRHIVVQGPRYGRTLTPRRGMIVIEVEPELVTLIGMADVVISAGGYNTVNEIRSQKTPAVFLPSARGRDDQADRVATLTDAGLAFAFPEVTAESLVQRVAQVVQNAALRDAMRSRYTSDHMQMGNAVAAQQILGLLTHVG